MKNTRYDRRGACSGAKPGLVKPFLTLGVLGLLCLPINLDSQTVSSFSELNDIARAATAGDLGSVRGLTDSVFNYTSLFANTPSAIRDRLFRAELAFRQGKTGPVSEDAVADAVNQLARNLGVPQYFETTKDQARALRVVYLWLAPNLVKSPTPALPSKVFGPDMSPAGAAFLGLLLVDQKAVNPDYRMTADEWLRRLKSPPRATGQVTVRYRTEARPASRVAVEFANRIAADLGKGGGSSVQLDAFFDSIGISK